MALSSTTLLWLRRDLRLVDHAALHQALEGSNSVQPVFVFDTDILKDFLNPHDRRLSFIADSLHLLDSQLKKRGGGLLVLYGSAQKLIPKAIHALHAKQLVASEDYEPYARARDVSVQKALIDKAAVTFVKDQVIFAPEDILRGDAPYKKFTPYSKRWQAAFEPVHAVPYSVKDHGRYASYESSVRAARHHGLHVLDPQHVSAMLEAIGYNYQPDSLWPVKAASKRLAHFMQAHARDYGRLRNLVAEDATSRLSPYIRFGLVSIRQCVQAALEAGAETWLRELIWREFFAMNLYHVPESAHTEWNPKYRHALAWSRNKKHLAAWKEGKTGYPLVDAGMRQLLEDGWMHNRARLVVSSFLCKHLRQDWREGEAHFGQYLMDYDLANNVGNWQWAASTGVDAQPWFRVFNPVTQSLKFDPRGEYIRRYVPELTHVRGKLIHTPWKDSSLNYYAPLVEHEQARADALAMFRQAKTPAAD